MKRILNYPGSKWRLAPWIIEHMPEHETYLEPFFGSGAVYFNKPLSDVETINDIDVRVVNLFRVIRDYPRELAYKVKYTPVSRKEYDLSFEISKEPIEDARRMLVCCWFGISGKTNSKAGFRSSVTKNGPRVIKEWQSIPGGIKEVSERLKKTQIECRDAIELIHLYNRQQVLIYADPPYIGEQVKSMHYKHEMNVSNHENLVDVLKKHEGPVLLSGYENDVYKQKLQHWKVLKKTSMTLTGSKRTECLWMNGIAAENSGQLSLFDLN